ncbi:hypothetical protein B0H17DRAFT_1191638 [Mycena rosella]|uniref:Uncharacterized protein n=1 Tax=Mycena rosella TaxID=1033263 RepID=A0AAD7MAK5_MYCRO|nr:hypothetical protein B0H17DRAFT_1191638 [Mycena rosella]
MPISFQAADVDHLAFGPPASASGTLPFPPRHLRLGQVHARDPSYLVANLTQDLNELASERQILAGMPDDLGVLFVDAAKEKIQRQGGAGQIEERVARRKRDASLHQAPPDAPQELLVLSSGPELPPRTATPRQRRNVNPLRPSTSTYYYQAASGLPLFLHPLDIKILAHFASYAAFPAAITVRVDALAEGTVNNELRKRCKYLAHIPDGADVEANLAGVVGGSEGGLKDFEGALRMRAARRKEKGRKDERARVRAEKRERDVLVRWRRRSRAGGVGRVGPAELRGGGSFVGGGAYNVARRGGAAREEPEEDQRDMDAAWHELESSSEGALVQNQASGKQLDLYVV